MCAYFNGTLNFFFTVRCVCYTFFVLHLVALTTFIFWWCIYVLCAKIPPWTKPDMTHAIIQSMITASSTSNTRHVNDCLTKLDNMNQHAFNQSLQPNYP